MIFFFLLISSHVNRRMQLWHWQAQMGGPGQQHTHLNPMQGPQIHLVMVLCQHWSGRKTSLYKAEEGA
jgi:hypothetical protein